MNCVLCHPNAEKVIWNNEKLRVIQVEDVNFPGYFRVIWNDHVAEMSDLDDEDRRMLEKILLEVEKVIRSEMCPDKINLAQFCNMVPHLHWHVIARFKNDSHFPESIWGIKQREVNSEQLAAWQTSADHCAEVIREKLKQLF